MKYLDPQKVFLDVGSNIGYYALLAAPYVQKVYAFEPDPRNIKPLKQNTDCFNNIEVVQKGIYAHNGQMQFELAERSEVSHLTTEFLSSPSVVDIEVTTIDSFLAEREPLPVTAIKTDAEGADFAALVGAKKTIERDQPLILSELWGVSDELASYVKELNYSIFAFGKPKEKSRQKLNQVFNFIEMGASNIHDFQLKMLFLVPQKLKAQFTEMTQF